MSELDLQAQRDFAVEVVETLREAGFLAYWAGGCVRDRLLQIVPKDYDVATNARPEEIRRVFGRRRTLAIGAAFGVITVLGSKPTGQIDVATFREDADYSDGRHPDSVSFSTPQHDAQRRDFTINGLFYDPVEDRVIDYVGGRDDLRLRRIRAIGDPRQRFTEDKLRMLRAIRFAATLDFAIEPATMAAIRQMAGELVVVSAERVSQEMTRMLVDPNRARAIQLLRESSLLDVVLPELAPWDSDKGDSAAWQTTIAVLDSLENPSPAMALAALLHCADGDDLADAVARRWRWSNREREKTVWLLANYRSILDGADLAWPRLQRLLVADARDELLELAAVVGGGRHAGVQHARQKLELPPDQLDPEPLLSGQDLIAHGLKPGKAFRRLLEEVRDAQLDGEVSSREEALALVDRLQADKPVE